MQPANDKRLRRLICLGLAFGCLIAYGGLLKASFIDYDDPGYVTKNNHVKHGLTFHNVEWAFTTGAASNWHPITWLSHMLDWQLYGLNPEGHHLTNLLFHIANTLLLFGLLCRMTGATWRSAVVAAFFAWHPLHVESVAWISERKDVLSTFFWLLSVLAYVRYRQQANFGSQAPDGVETARRRLCYVASLGFFALGLMSKPMVVTLPFILLLLDYWPLGGSNALEALRDPRQRWKYWGPLVIEKLPFFALAAASSIVTFLVQRTAGAMTFAATTTFGQRAANAVVSYVRYLAKTVWPSPLAVFYPFVFNWPAWQVVGAGLILAVVTVAAVAARRRRPFVLVGWFWYLGMLVPVIGLVQVGLQSMADRYSYLPLVGIFILVVWLVADLAARWPGALQMALGPATALILVVSLVLTRVQAGYWRDGLTLFIHDAAVTPDNFATRDNLGAALQNAGRIDEAIEQYKASLRLEPRAAVAPYDLGLICVRQGKNTEAMQWFEESLRRQPGYTVARYNLARQLAAAGRTDEALQQYEQCVREEPEEPDIHYNFANTLLAQGMVHEAADEFRESIRLEPESADAYNNLGAALFRMGDLQGAAAEVREALRRKPDFAEAEDQLGVVLQKQGDADGAKACYARAIALKPDLVHARLKLGLLLAREGQIGAAREQFAKAVELAPSNDAAQYNLGGSYEALGNYAEAAAAFSEAARLRPEDSDIHARLAAVQAKAGRYGDAIIQYQLASRLKPDWVAPDLALAGLLLTNPVSELRNGQEATRRAERARELTGGRDVDVLAALDQAYAMTGRLADAIRTAEEALSLARAQHLPEAAEAAAGRLRTYRARSAQAAPDSK